MLVFLSFRSYDSHMKTIIKNKKTIIKLLFVLILILAAGLWSRDSLAPIFEQVMETKLSVIIIICTLSLGYFLFEGINLWRLSRKYVPSFTLQQGIGCSFYACFYRTATLGSASFAAGMYYLHKNKVPLANTLGLITLQYVSYKIAIALFCGICLLTDYRYMNSLYGSYFPFILLGFLLTVLIALVLLLICICTPFHNLLLFAARKMNRRGTYTDKIKKLEEEFISLRKGTRFLMKDKIAMLSLVLRNLIRLIFWYCLPCFLFGTTTLSEIRHTISISSLVTALAGVLPSPAGIGSTEFLFTAFFSGIYGTTMAASSMLLYRFATFIFPFFMGILVVLYRGGKK